MVRLQRLPPIDHCDRALLVDRVLRGDVTLDGYAGGAFESVACWAGSVFNASVEESSNGVEIVLRPMPNASPAGLLEKRIRIDRNGELTVRYRWDPAAFPADAFFCPEISVSPEVQLDLTPAADVWKFPITTVSRSERGFEETVQGYSYTPRWPVRAGEARLTVRVRPSA
jgi:alpha-amylase